MPVTGRAAPWFTPSLLALCVGNGAVESVRADGYGHGAYRVNGVRFDVVTLQLAGDPGRIAEALSAYWATARAGAPRLQRRGQTWILGRQRGSLHETVELRAGVRPGVVDGRVAVVDLALRSAGAPDQPFRLPAGVRRLQVVEDLVAEDRSVVFVMASRVGVATTWARLQRALEAAGLATAGRATADRAPADEGGEAGAWLFEAHDAVGFLEGVIQRGTSGTRIVLVHRRHRPEAADASH